METIYEDNYITLYSTVENIKLLNQFRNINLFKGVVETNKIKEEAILIIKYENKEYEINIIFDVVLIITILDLGLKINYTTILKSLIFKEGIPIKAFNLLNNLDSETDYLINIINMIKKELN